MHSPKRIKITDVNPHLICVLCGGYYVDATTVIECLHSFCKTCIVKYLEKNKYCPICDVQIHKTTPLLNIRPDKTLQNIVYKLVPSLFKNEMQRRVDFYQMHPTSLPPYPEQRGEITDTTPILFPDELLIICLEHHGNQPSQQACQRYLHCPAALSISHLVKLIKGKFDLNAKHQVHMFFKDDLLMEHITLMDIAYTYQCRRKVPIQLTYKILELKTKRIRIINREPVKDEIKKGKPEEKEWKEVQLQISENGVMSVRNVESCECSPIPAVEAPPVYSPSMSSSSTNCVNNVSSNNDMVVSQATTLGSEQSTAVESITSDISMDTTPVSLSSQSTDSLSMSQKSPTVANSPPISTASLSVPKTSASTFTSAQVAVTSSYSIVTSAPVVIASSTSGTTQVSTVTSLSAGSAVLSASTPNPVKTEALLTPSTKGIPSIPTERVPPVPLKTTPIPTTSAAITCSPSVSLPVSISAPAVSVATHPAPTTPMSLGTFSMPSLSSSPTMSVPYVSISSVQSISLGMEPHIVTTMAGTKPSTHLVPSSFPIMSSCRPQNEPILSVSKVSKDQVRKPNNVIEVNKLSISRVPPGGIKEKGENLNKIVNKLSPNERVIGNTSVTIRPVTNTPSNPPPKMYPISRPAHPSPPTSVSKEKPQQMRYKTLKSPTKQWNPSIDRNTQMQLMKQNADQSKPPRFFRMRNMPRFLGNPSSGVKPLYACPEEPIPNQAKQKLTLMKVDPKTIPTSSIPRSPTKQPPPYTPGSPKMSKPPPAYPDPKPPYLNTRMPSPAHAGSFLPPNPYHLLYSGYPGFTHETNRMLSPELIRSMCAYHPSLPPSIGMLFNPTMHPALPRPQENYNKPETTPAVQRIPPSKTDTPPPKPPEDKRFPSPVGMSDSKKLIPTPPPISPKEVEKPLQPPPITQESKLKSVPAEPVLQVTNEVKENHSELVSGKAKVEESNVVKSNCDDININNNNSKESPPSQPSESLASRPQ